MSDQPNSTISLDLIDRLVKSRTDDRNDPSKDMANLLDEEDAERTWSIIRAFFSPMSRDPVFVVAADRKQWCYMIVTPPPNTRVSGIRCEKVNSRGGKVKVYQWLIKFGDGDPRADPDASGRYKTHNPSYRVEVNKTGREAKRIEAKVFQDRGFISAGNSREWYVVWNHWEPAEAMQKLLERLLKEWPKVDMNQADKRDKLIAQAKQVFPRKCNKAV